MRVRDPSSSSGAGIQQRLFFRWPLGLVRPWRSVGPPRLMRQVGARLSCTTLAKRWHGYQPRRIPCPLRCLPATPQKIALGRCRRSSALCPRFLNPYGRVAQDRDTGHTTQQNPRDVSTLDATNETRILHPTAAIRLVMIDPQATRCDYRDRLRRVRLAATNGHRLPPKPPLAPCVSKALKGTPGQLGPKRR